MSLSASVAVRDITPPPGAPLWGYTEREGPATGTLDPLCAKAAVFRANGTTVAIVSLDLGRVPLEHICSRIRRRAETKGVDYVFFAATHTHHAPAMEIADAPYMPQIESGIGDAIEEAVERLEPARIGAGRTMIDIAHNRRKLLKDGRCFMIWRNEERLPTSPVDREAAIIKVTNLGGKPLFTLVHFACHPVVMGQSNYLYSADYVGEMSRLVREQTGAECVFLQGACGNINPYLDKTHIGRGAVEAMRSVGRECAEQVLRAFKGIDARAPEAPSVAFVEKPVAVGARWDLTDAATIEVLREAYAAMFDFYIGSASPDLAVPLSVIVLNGALAFVGMPGEIFVQYQLALKEKSPLRNSLLCGYANGYYAYFPTVRDAVAGGYGGTVASFVGLGAGDKLLLEAEIEIARLTGKCTGRCSPGDLFMLEEGPIPE